MGLRRAALIGGVEAGDRADQEAGGGGGDQRVEGYDERLVLGLGVDRRSRRRRAIRPAIPPSTASSADSVEELGCDVAAGGAERAAQADLAAALEHEMTMMFAIPIAPTSSATAPSPSEQGGELALGGGARLERVRGPADLDAVRVLGVGGRGEQVRRPR